VRHRTDTAAAPAALWSPRPGALPDVRHDGSPRAGGTPSAPGAQEGSTDTTRYELRFAGLFDRGRGYVFPCDPQGTVDMNAMTERARANYLFARAMVGNELCSPIVLPVP
jgi:hypothetical protein